MENKILTKLPMKKGIGKNTGKLVVDWSKISNMDINILFNNEEYIIYVVKYIKEKQRLILKYKNKESFITTGSFIKCGFSKVFEIITNVYKYNINEIIKTKIGKIKILEKVLVYNSMKGYKYKCLIDGNIDTISEYEIDKGVGCNVCVGRKVLIGYNDIATTHPWMMKYFKNKEDAKRYTYNSNKKILGICPDCGREKNIVISNIYYQGFSCKYCSDGKSFSEKFMLSLLLQLQEKYSLEFELEKKDFKWLKDNDKRYDFAVFYNKETIIIETHGIQHYEESFHFKKSSKCRSLKEEMANDKLKKELALNSGEIKNENYIEVNCKESTLEYLKNSILQSELNILFDLTIIDYEKCSIFALSSLMKSVIEKYNATKLNPVDLERKYFRYLCTNTIRTYLKKGKILKLCDYDAKKSIAISAKEKRSKGNCYMARKVICINNGKQFETLDDSALWCGLKSTSRISGSCMGKCKSAGKHPITGEPLTWMYYEDYINHLEKAV